MPNDPLDPSEVAEVSSGPEESPMAGHIETEGIGVSGEPEPGPDTGGSLVESLWNTEPNRSLAEIDSPWDPEQGGIPRVYRGIQKMADVDGLPAIADIVIGLAEEYTKRNGVPSPSDSPDESGSDDDSDSISLQGVPTVGDA